MWQNAERKSEWMLQQCSGAAEESHVTRGMVSREWKLRGRSEGQMEAGEGSPYSDWKMPRCSRRVQQCGGRVHGVAECCRIMAEVPAAR